MRDDFDPVMADRFKVVSQVPVPETWTRVQSKVLNHMPVRFTEEEATMIDLETPMPAAEHRGRPKRVVVASLLAAAAVVAIAVVAIRQDDPVSPADQPSPTVTVPATVPRAMFSTPGASYEQLVPGTYFLDEVGGSPTPRIFVTLGDAWSNFDGWGISKEGIGEMTFSRPVSVVFDACHFENGYHPGPVTNLDGLVAALSEQTGWTDVTAPSDISVSGYAGKTFQRTAPAGSTDCNFSTARLLSWGISGPPGGWSTYRPGEIETLRVLDINGTIIIINTRLSPEHQDAAAVAELADVIDSIRIEQT